MVCLNGFGFLFLEGVRKYRSSPMGTDFWQKRCGEPWKNLNCLTALDQGFGSSLGPLRGTCE
jgi:hypothetical protein